MARRATNIPQFISSIRAAYPDKDTFTIAEMKKMPSAGISVPHEMWFCGIEGTRPRQLSITILEERYNARMNGTASPVVEKAEAPKNVEIMQDAVPVVKEAAKKEQSLPTTISMYIPGVDPDFIPYGKNYDTVKTIVESGEFFPCYIYGISGVGKTSTIEHVCAMEKRPFFRVQITPETMDEDLIGAMKLVNGDTVWQDGPIIKAYRCGGVVVLDECDLNAGLMILQPILEKKPFYIKQTGELVHPQPGFTVFATGNTKGDGNDPRYIGTTTLNDAFLERFAITLEQTFMPIAEETKVAKQFCKNNGVKIENSLLKELMRWVDVSRQTYVNNGNDGVYISTRRINFILKAYKMTGDMETALKMTLARYSDNEQEALMMIWKSVHVEKPAPAAEKPAKNNAAASSSSNTSKTLAELLQEAAMMN